jgi:hypothetical protein
MLVSVAALEAQTITGGPTIAAARAGFSMAPSGTLEALDPFDPTADCGSTLKNAALLGLGVALAVGVIELTYTIIREPFVRNGQDLPQANPILIAWGGGTGFVVGLVGTELCRRRRR